MAIILQPDPESLTRLAQHLAEGGIAALPTETVYGLAADATCEHAVARIYAAKKRPSHNPLIVHLADAADVLRWSEPHDGTWERLAQAFWPGPLTLVLPRKPSVPDAVTAGRDTVALRVPDNPLTREVIRLAGRPLAAPSANPSGYVSPTTAAHVQDSLGNTVPYILDGGPCRSGIESTIVDLSRPGVIEILRRGPITAGDLERTLGAKVQDQRLTMAEGEAHRSPGLFSAHYQPATPVFLWQGSPPPAPMEHQPRCLLFYRKPEVGEASDAYWLCEDGDPEEAARNLYHCLRSLDHGGYRSIYAEIAPATPLGLSINDRLLRSASGHAG